MSEPKCSGCGTPMPEAACLVEHGIQHFYCSHECLVTDEPPPVDVNDALRQLEARSYATNERLDRLKRALNQRLERLEQDEFLRRHDVRLERLEDAFFAARHAFDQKKGD